MGFFLGCAAITVVTTIGIVLVLGVETINFFRETGESVSFFLFTSKLEPDAVPPGSASSP